MVSSNMQSYVFLYMDTPGGVKQFLDAGRALRGAAQHGCERQTVTGLL